MHRVSAFAFKYHGTLWQCCQIKWLQRWTHDSTSCFHIMTLRHVSTSWLHVNTSCSTSCFHAMSPPHDFTSCYLVSTSWRHVMFYVMFPRPTSCFHIMTPLHVSRHDSTSCLHVMSPRHISASWLCITLTPYRDSKIGCTHGHAIQRRCIAYI